MSTSAPQFPALPRENYGMDMEHIPELLTIQDFVARFRVSRTATYRLLASRDLTAKKVGRRTMIPLSVARRWAASLPPATPAAPKAA